ncbi:DUF4474 domain-containing protein [bacterium C-53]|nr:DUF4474 domain-containing protein [Lachnospiraceae bacterium]NBI02893.1 DUF4474 domain-containing protein [Lachnospiraceae bacterium]RKJ11017.1 DUF4474 domain-containing protein [bacterium C-53]
MYLFFGIIFLILLFFFCLNHWRRKKIICKIRSMCMEEKCQMLEELIQPFGYSYVLSQDIFTSNRNAWQREFGYCALYDKAAPNFQMVFDSLPVYFDYNDRTWLIEFWKGQYGINTGCEIGVYYADRILNEEERKYTIFQSVEDGDMLPLSFVFFRQQAPIAALGCRHWWLTAFLMGCYSRPSELTMQVCITFPCAAMAEAFIYGLEKAGYPRESIHACCNTVTFSFAQAPAACGFFRKIRICIAQWCNRFWCRIYLFVTRPFCLSVDKILYLYNYLPFAFRRMFRLRRFKKHRRKRHK